MKSPDKQLKEYLEKLIFKVSHIRSLYKQIVTISQWETPDRIIALEIGSNFFELTLFSFRRTIIIELCKLLAEREDKSLIDLLLKLKENVKSLEPSIYAPRFDNTARYRKRLKPEEYIEITNKHLNEINKHDKLIKTLISRRDKYIAHSDSTFFINPQKLHALFPLNDLEIGPLLDTISEILRKHHSLLLHADITIEINSVHDVDTVLKNIRAFYRVWHDKRLTRDFGIRVCEYLKDNYDRSQSD